MLSLAASREYEHRPHNLSPYHSHFRQMSHGHDHHQPHNYNPLPSPTSSISSNGHATHNPLLSSMPPGEGGSSSPPARCCETSAAAPPTAPLDAAVTQALEIARESPDGAQDPTVSQILEQALADIWAKVQAQPHAYIMTRDEFAIFNFFQHRFAGDKTAVMARKRYWDNARA